MSILDKFSLNGKVAVVTGGNRGIGRAIAGGFAEAGATVVIAARNEKKSAEAAKEIEASGGRAIAVTSDVSDRAQIERMIDTVTSDVGPIDVLVNNAGIGFHADALTLEDSEWNRLFGINLEGVWMTSQIVGRGMTRRRSGSIINIGSISGLIINRPQWHSPYGISKAAVHHLTRSLAAEWSEVRRTGERNRAWIREDGDRVNRIRGVSALLERRSSDATLWITGRDRAGCALSRERCLVVHDRGGHGDRRWIHLILTGR